MQNRYFEIEFCSENPARLLRDNPYKVNAITALAPLKTAHSHTFFMSAFAVAFHNQVSVFGFFKGENKIALIVDIFVDDIEEDILCLDYDEPLNYLAFGGKLGVGYIYEVGPSKTAAQEVDVEKF